MARAMRRGPWLGVLGQLLLFGVACSPTPNAVGPAATTVAPVQAMMTPSPTARVSASVAIVEAAEQYFNPDQITVRVGTTVVWNDVQGTHDMVADDKSFASAVLFEGGSYAHLFNTAGRYRYVCTLHVGAGMWAEIDVQ
jgi:plastocyanin